MAEKDSIEFMKKMWQSKAVKSYKRKKMNTSENGTPASKTSKKSSLLLLDDMELDSDGELLKSFLFLTYLERKGT